MEPRAGEAEGPRAGGGPRGAPEGGRRGGGAGEKGEGRAAEGEGGEGAGEGGEGEGTVVVRLVIAQAPETCDSTGSSENERTIEKL